MVDALDNLAKLPPKCAAIMNNAPVFIHRGANQPQPALLAPDQVQQWNVKHNVTLEQVNAMMAGVTLGWDREAADPDSHIVSDSQTTTQLYTFAVTLAVTIEVQANSESHALHLATTKAENLADQIVFDLNYQTAKVEAVDLMSAQ